MTRHKVHSMNTHTAERRSIKTDETECCTFEGIGAGGITGLQKSFATAVKTEP